MRLGLQFDTGKQTGLIFPEASVEEAVSFDLSPIEISSPISSESMGGQLPGKICVVVVLPVGRQNVFGEPRDVSDDNDTAFGIPMNNLIQI